MSKFTKLLIETLGTIDEEAPPMVDPNIDPATGMPINAMVPSGPAADAENLKDDSHSIDNPGIIGLIEVMKKLLYINPSDILQDATMSVPVSILGEDLTNQNADEQLDALRVIARDSVELDTDLKSADDGSVNR